MPHCTELINATLPAPTPAPVDRPDSRYELEYAKSAPGPALAANNYFVTPTHVSRYSIKVALATFLTQHPAARTTQYIRGIVTHFLYGTEAQGDLHKHYSMPP